MWIAGLFALAAVAADLPQDDPSVPGQVTSASPYWDIEVLYATERHEEALNTALARIEASPADAELYWLAARAQFEHAEQFRRDDASVDKLAMYQNMLDITNRGLAVDANHGHLHFAKSAAIGRMGTTRGVLASLFSAKEMEQAALKTIASGYTYRSIGGYESLPTDAHLVLGIFYRLVPDSWAVKLLSGTRGDIDKSIEHLTKARAGEPKRKGIVKELGAAYLCKATRTSDAAAMQKGMETLQEALVMDNQVDTDVIDQEHVALMMADPNMACGYSRDGQQENDEAKVKEWEARQKK